ncbi:MAG: DnaJ domain-containing protein [Chloroflexota bacterium]
MENYYERLKVPVDASDNLIKMQYRRLAKHCHPDLNPDNPQASEEFRKLHLAYTILSDSEKRRAYNESLDLKDPNRTNPNGQHHPRPQPQPWPQGYVRRTGPRRHMYKPDKPRSSFFNYAVDLTIQELFRGARRNLTIGQTHSCPRCRGKGVLGTGEKCFRCGGYTFLVSYEQVELIIPPGILPGTMIRLEIGGSYSPNSLLDALYIDEVLVAIEIRENERFINREQHLYTTIPVPATLLKEGGKWTLAAPEGDELFLSLTIPPNTTSGTILNLRRQGLKNGASQRRGNLYCTLVAEKS